MNCERRVICLGVNFGGNVVLNVFTPKCKSMYAHIFKGCIGLAGQSLLSAYLIALIILTIRQ
jgi:hypothetical protein